MMSPPVASKPTLIITREQIRQLLDMPACIEAVENVFRQHARGLTLAPAVTGTHVAGGGFHTKTAGILGSTDTGAMFVAKVNANFPANPDRFGLPTIQGIAALFDAKDGQLLALLDSMELTSVRTAASTAVAAKFLARDDAETVTICGCGEQSRNQLRALACVRRIRHINAYDVHRERARDLARDITSELDIPVSIVDALGDATHASDIWVTCTPARRWFLGRQHVAPGAFVAAVGADNPEKQEIEPLLMAENTVVADIVDQCASIGDLHHALNDGVMHRGDVRADLAQIVTSEQAGRRSRSEIIVFDSTGTALEDVAVAALAYRSALSRGAGLSVDFADSARSREPNAAGAPA
jgi:ornithine cyclodeaminase/alanine dehydrogenase-like protein (mu-crystallin family)